MQTGFQSRHQAGLSTVASVAALSGIMVLFLIIFLLANGGSGNKPPETNNNNNSSNTQQNQPSSDSTSTPFIRIPSNSFIYSNASYKFSFAYPESFLTLEDGNVESTNLLAQAESAMASNKPIGNSGAIMNGRLGAFVYKKENFIILVDEPNTMAGPTKTGNDTTWKIVSAGSNSTYGLGSAFDAQSITSQTGVKVFTFPRDKNTSLVGRLVFEAGDYYVLVVLPTVTRPDGGVLTAADTSAYNVVLGNVAKTVRVFTSSNSNSSNSSTNSSNSTNTSNSNTTN